MVEELAEEGHPGGHGRVVGVAGAEGGRLGDRAQRVRQVVARVERPVLRPEPRGRGANGVGDDEEANTGTWLTEDEDIWGLARFNDENDPLA